MGTFDMKPRVPGVAVPVEPNGNYYMMGRPEGDWLPGCDPGERAAVKVLGASLNDLGAAMRKHPTPMCPGCGKFALNIDPFSAIFHDHKTECRGGYVLCGVKYVGCTLDLGGIDSQERRDMECGSRLSWAAQPPPTNAVDDPNGDDVAEDV